MFVDENKIGDLSKSIWSQSPQLGRQRVDISTIQGPLHGLVVKGWIVSPPPPLYE